jgi:hypothetical protein
MIKKIYSSYNILKLLLWVLLSAISLSADCCDYCNCYLGLNPLYKKNTVGLRYYTMDYSGSHLPASELTEHNLSKDDFWEKRNSIEFHSQFYLTPRIQLLFSLPYIFNTEGMSTKAENAFAEEQEAHHEESSTIKGVGDPLLILNYQLYNVTNDSGKYSHRIFAGAGLKFPIGNYKIAADEEPVERVHQPGSGSFDYILNLTYLARKKSNGFIVNATYLLTSANSQSFRFGNRFNANAIFYYQVNSKKIIFYPNAGMYIEQSAKDIDDKNYVENSGGTINYAHAGFDVYYKNVSLNAAIHKPVLQSLNGDQPEMNYRLIFGFTYGLK